MPRIRFVVVLAALALSTAALAVPLDSLPAPEAAVDVSLTAALEGRWPMAVAGLLLVVLLVLRKVGASFWPVLGTDEGGAALAAGAGAVFGVVELLQSTQHPTMAVVLVAAASGFWGWAKKLGLVGMLLRLIHRAPAQAPLPSVETPPNE